MSFKTFNIFWRFLVLACVFFSLPAFAFDSTLPIAATDVAHRWDTLYLFLVWLSVFFFVLVMGATIVFAWKYRLGAGTKIKYLTGSHALEAVWIIIPTALLMVIFAWGWSVYTGMTQAPNDAYEVRVIGKQWLWQFVYDSGKTTVGELYVPLNKPVKLIMTSEDVLHSFFVPNFRIKQDVVPGMYTSVWFEARIPGKHQIFCAEYCGTSHSQMLAKVIVLNDADWKAWQAGKKIGDIPDAVSDMQLSNAAAPSIDKVAVVSAQAVPPHFEQVSLVEQGKHVAQVKGCVACHSDDGSKKVGPSHKGLFGSMVELSDGKFVRADENYIRESIEKPQAKLVKGYSPIMPTFQGLVSEQEMVALVAYIKSLK